MARGYPDFFGFSVFPQFGSFTEESGAPTDILAGDSADFFELNAKGVIYDGYHRIYDCSDPGNVYVNLTVDDETCPSFFLDIMLRYNVIQEGDYLITLKEYNIELGEFIVAIRNGVTFSLNFKTTVGNNSADDISVTAVLIWAHLQ